MEETTTILTTTLIESGSDSETTTTTTVPYPYEEQVSYIRGDLDLIAGLLVAFMIIELCKWSYRFFNMFFPI